MGRQNIWALSRKKLLDICSLYLVKPYQLSAIIVNAEGSVHNLVHGIKLHFTERTEENHEK
jgi:hypothetical protein